MVYVTLAILGQSVFYHPVSGKASPKRFTKALCVIIITQSYDQFGGKRVKIFGTGNHYPFSIFPLTC